MKRNYNYGRIRDGVLQFAPNKLIIGAEQIFNAPAEVYVTQGWLPIVKTESPTAEEGFYYSPTYVEQDGVIVQQWVKVEDPETDEATEADYVAALEGLGVSFGD